jgi:antitoxin component YwqK of YwqJK toxin-antitoxin module
LNSSGNKQGLWKEFYEDGTTKMAGTYRDGIKDGYFKFYDVNGNLTHIQKYRNGIIEDEPAELAKLEIRTDYYEDGSIKLVGSYKDGMAEGTRREYDRSGKITDSYLMHRGIIVGHGIIDEAGKKQGDWEIFYDNGRLRGKGKYIDNRLVGIWTYYFENGKIEQTGSFDDKGEYTGDWKWYYEDGSLRIVEQYFEGEREGDFVEYDQLGEIMVEGSYVNGLKEGNWTTNVNGYIEVGSYLENVRDGDWKYYYAKDTLYFEGRFLDGSEDGTHTWYYRNGKTQKTGNYIMSLKNGDWKYYSEEGLLLLKIRFKDGIEKDYDNVRIEPEMELKDMEE